MSAVDVLLAIRAANSGEVQPRTSVRHRHLADDPLVIVAYRMAGEMAAPLGLMFGTSEDSRSLLVAPEPRSIGIRFRDVMDPFGAALCEWLEPFIENHTTERVGRRELELCTSVPQILVPNRATAAFVGSVLGRSLRYLRTEGEGAVPTQTVLAGNHLTWFEHQSSIPGSCVLLTGTDVLRRHFATGQSDLEDEDLHVLLAWVDPPAGKDGADAARTAEAHRFDGSLPAIGPTPDADWDRDVLDPLLGVFNEQRAGSNEPDVVEALGGDIRDTVERALVKSWEATWEAHRILRAMPAGHSVAERWQSDRRAWSYHAQRVREHRAFFRIKDTAKQAAWMLSDREGALAAVEAGEALDDPMVLAGLVASGQTLLGDVMAVDLENREQGPKQMVKRPLIEVDLAEPCPMPLGSKLYWTERPGKMQVEIVTIAGNTTVLKVVKGMTGDLPSSGSRSAFADLTLQKIPPPRAPQYTPWTHIGAETPKVDSETPE